MFGFVINIILGFAEVEWFNNHLMQLILHCKIDTNSFIDENKLHNISWFIRPLWNEMTNECIFVEVIVYNRSFLITTKVAFDHATNTILKTYV